MRGGGIPDPDESPSHFYLSIIPDMSMGVIIPTLLYLDSDGVIQFSQPVGDNTTRQGQIDPACIPAGRVGMAHLQQWESSSIHIQPVYLIGEGCLRIRLRCRQRGVADPTL